LFREAGKKVYPLTRDHKPCDEIEKKRIIEAGGQIYQTSAPAPLVNPNGKGEKQEMIVGPYRVLPGRLSVCRTFGDAEAKLEQYGGNPQVVIATPEIKSFKINESYDFIMMGSDGIFDKLSNKDVVQCVWNSTKTERAGKIHQQCGIAVDNIMKNALLRRSLDNVTSLIIAFENMKKCLTETDPRKENAENLPINNINVRNSVQDTHKEEIGKGRKSEQIANHDGEKKATDAKVVKKIMPSSTRAITNKHFDFSEKRTGLLPEARNPTSIKH
jgi:protein phosphatase 2C family protein 2/3